MPSPSNSKRTHTGLANNAGAGAIGFCNGEMTMDEHGWTVIPFGMWPHAKGLQNFGKEQATAIYNAWHGMMGVFKRAVVGYPVYKGHPDVPGLEEDFPDKTEYGQIADMEIRPNGLAIKQVLSNAGAELVKAGWKFISPFWDAEPSGTKDGHILWSPFKINSIGLVKRPNIPNKSLANNSPMNKALLALLKLAADSTDDQVLAAVTTLANNYSTGVTSLANAETAKTAAEQAAATSKTALETANTALANEKAARVIDALDGAVKTGRITIAEKPVWKGRLETNFAVESAALANVAPTVKVTGTAEQAALAKLNQRLESMTPAERTEWAKTGQGLQNDDDESEGGMPNVKTISNLVANEMESPACKHIKSPSARHAAAFNNVMKAHPEFLKEPAAAESS